MSTIPPQCHFCIRHCASDITVSSQGNSEPGINSIISHSVNPESEAGTSTDISSTAIGYKRRSESQ